MARSTRFSTVPLNTTGGSYMHRNIPISSQRTLNMYPEATPDGITPSALLRWPGTKSYPSGVGATESPVKMVYFWRNEIYYASDELLKKIDINENITNIGPISGPSYVFSASNNSDTLVIATGGSFYKYDGTTLSIEPSVYWNPKKVDFLNERFITDGDDGGTYMSDVLSTNFDIANVFYTRSKPDEQVGPVVFNQIIYGFNTNHIEPWADSPGAPPASRINEAIIESVGASCIEGIAASDNYIYFIGSDAIVYRLASFQAEPISNPVISTYFKSLDFSSVKADSFVWNGQRFVSFTFYRDSETWVFGESTGEWFEVGYSDAVILNVINAWSGRAFCSDSIRNVLRELVNDTVTVSAGSGDMIRTLSVISGDDFGSPQSMLEMSKLILNVQVGSTGILASTSGNSFFENPTLMVECSFDGGYTFQSKPIYVSLGRSGDFTRPVEVHIMKQFRRAVFRLKVNSFFGQFAIMGAAIDIREAGQ